MLRHTIYKQFICAEIRRVHVDQSKCVYAKNNIPECATEMLCVKILNKYARTSYPYLINNKPKHATKVGYIP